MSEYKTVLLHEGEPGADFNVYRSASNEGWPLVIDTRTGTPYYYVRNVGFTPFGGGGFAPLSTGAEPLVLVSDGAGQCVMVPYS